MEIFLSSVGVKSLPIGIEHPFSAHHPCPASGVGGGAESSYLLILALLPKHQSSAEAMP